MGDETVRILKANPFHDTQSSKTNFQKKKYVYLGIAILAYALIALLIFGISLPNHFMQTEKGTHFGEVETNAGNYVGQIYNLAYEGEGEFQYLQGASYKGNFSHSKREGKGVFNWTNGDSFSGDWKADAMLSGTYVFADGRTYSGTFQNNQYEDGTFELGKAAAKYGFVSYKADIKEGNIDHLSFQKTDGTVYEGTKDGTAKITYADGNIYEGAVTDGKRSGEGVFTWMQEGAVIAKYSGQWSNNQMDGKGTYYYNDSEYPRIEGNFKNGKLDGAAVYYKNASQKYNTKWQDGSCINNDVK